MTERSVHHVRPEHVETVGRLLGIVQQYVAKEIDDRAFLDTFAGAFYVHALDGHEDPEGEVPHEQLMATLSLRILHDVELVTECVFDDATPGGSTSPTCTPP